MYDIRKYKDFRAFLSACFLSEKKLARGSLSTKSYAERLGLSESSFRMIIAGKRNLTITNILGIAKALKFTQAQTEIFETIVLRDQSIDGTGRQYYAKKLNKLNEQNKLENIRTSDKFVISDTFIPTLLVYLMDKKITSLDLSESEMKEISEKLNVTMNKLKSALSHLRESKSLHDATEKTHITFDKVMSTIDRTNFLRQSFHEVASQIGKDSKNDNTLYSVKTFSVDVVDVDSFGQEYKALIEKYMAKRNPLNEPHIIKTLFCLKHLTK